MAYDNNDKRAESIYSKRIRAGKRRTYFFDVRSTRGNDYYLTITESRKRFTGEGYDRHKIFLYKEDFNKFIKGLNEAVDYVKTELMPDFDFDAFNHEYAEGEEGGEQPVAARLAPPQQGRDEDEDDESTVEDVQTAPAPVAEAPAAPVSSASAGDNGANEEVDKW